MRTTYREIDEDKFEVFVHHGMTKEMIGIVYRDFHQSRGCKWAIKAQFMSLLADHEDLDDVYFDSIEAGRILVAAWNRIRAATRRETTAEYNMEHLFGTD
jgi:hypothetical protein